MTGDTRIFHAVPLQNFVQLLPELLVLDRRQLTFLLAFPPVGLPLRHPFGHAFAHVNAVGKQFDMARSLKRSQALHDRFQFHPIVRRFRCSARFFDLFVAGKMAQNKSPAARTRVAAATSVSEQMNFDRFVGRRNHCGSLLVDTVFTKVVARWAMRQVHSGPPTREPDGSG